MGARETALTALMACRQKDAWSNAVLKDYIARDKLDGREAALASRLCYGVLQNRMKLDFYLKQLLTGKLRDLHPVVRDILHLGLYQLLEMDKIPESAAVNESVALGKKYCKNPKAASLINGVLRNAVRRQSELLRPTSFEEKYSHPSELISLLKGSLPKGTLEGMLRADNESPATVVQVNTLKITTESLLNQLAQEGVTAEKFSWLSDCLVLKNTGNLEKLPSFRSGLYYVQDPAARLAVECAGLPREGAKVLDCCSAPGGKSFAAAIAMGGKGKITSCDIHPHKLPLIQKGAERLGMENITTCHQNGSEFRPEWEGAFDTVICDVPCSGLGIIRKKPDIRYKDLTELENLPALQLAILMNQARYVRPGGVLIYSTCTVLKRENEEVLAAFLSKNDEYSLEPLKLPGVFPENTNGMLILIPGQYDTDGFFISRLRRKS